MLKAHADADSSKSCKNPNTVTLSDSKCVVKKPVPNFPVVLLTLFCSKFLSLVETCSIRKTRFFVVNNFPLCLNSIVCFT